MPKPDPKEEAASKVKAIEDAIATLVDSPHLQSYKACLEADLKKAKKSANDSRSLAKRLDMKEA